MSDDFLCANYSSREWHVNAKSGTLQISTSAVEERPELPPNFQSKVGGKGRTVAAKTSDGWLIGFDAGEFGGGLWWASEDGLRKKKLSDENIHVILPRGDELLVFAGLAHMTLDEGRVYAYRTGGPSDQRLVALADLGSAPNAALIDKNGNVLIAAQTRVIAIDRSNHVRLLYQDSEMGALYTNTIAEDPAGNVFVGMRFFVLRLRRSQNDVYTPEWYVPDRCTKRKVVRFDSVCTANEQRH
jgi:ligand-binding sensor domain-containing protein